VAKTIIRTTNSGANDTNGGAYESPATYSRTYNRDGTTVVTTTSGLVAANNGAGKVRLTSVDFFVNVVAGMYAYTGWNATYALGAYKITASTADTVDLDLAYSLASTCTYISVGGALATMAEARTRAASGDKIIAIGGRRQRRGRGRMTTSLRARRV